MPTFSDRRRFVRTLLLALAGLLAAAAARAQTAAIADAADYSRERMATLYAAASQGTNLAAGRVLSYAPSPDYPLTAKDGTDTRDLTDGVLVAMPDQRIWWDAQAVGWSGPGTRKIILDFGAPQCVSHLVWRVVAGSHVRGFGGPRQVRVYGSLDGDTAYLLTERGRWAEDSARPDAYRLPNLGPPAIGDDVYVYPLRLELQGYRVRYLILEFEQDSVWFCSDELAVIAGAGDGQALDGLKSERLQTRDVWITFDEPVIPVATDVKLPLWFRQTDLRVGGAQLPVRYEFEVPVGATLHVPELRYSAQRDGRRVTVSHHAGGNSTEIGPFFITAAADLPAGSALRFRASGDQAAPQPWHDLGLRPALFPAPFTLRRLTTSIGWMIDSQRVLWPDFAENYRRLGFNTVPVFPRAWEPAALAAGLTLQTLEADPDPAGLTAEGRRIADLRQSGFKTIYMESPLHVVNWMYPEAAKDYRCDGGPITDIASFCPSYRGDHYTRELERLRRCYLLMGGADYVMWDCELLGSSKWESPACSRCTQAKAATAPALDWPAFLQRQVTDMLRDMNAQVTAPAVAAESRHWPRPALGMYAVDTTALYSGLLTFPCDGIFDFQNTSLYAGDHPEQIHRVIRDARARTTANNIIPWLTTGTGGRVSPVNARIIVWEALVNGAIGLTYFTFSDLTPSHYYEIALALSQVAPVEDILYAGQPAWAEFQLTAGNARLSATRLADRCVLLLVNDQPQEQTLTWQHDSGLQGSVRIPAGEAVLQTLVLK